MLCKNPSTASVWSLARCVSNNNEKIDIRLSAFICWVWSTWLWRIYYLYVRWFALRPKYGKKETILLGEGLWRWLWWNDLPRAMVGFQKSKQIENSGSDVRAVPFSSWLPSMWLSFHPIWSILDVLFAYHEPHYEKNRYRISERSSYPWTNDDLVWSSGWMDDFPCFLGGSEKNRKTLGKNAMLCFR